MNKLILIFSIFFVSANLVSAQDKKENEQSIETKSKLEFSRIGIIDMQKMHT